MPGSKKDEAIIPECYRAEAPSFILAQTLVRIHTGHRAGVGGGRHSVTTISLKDKILLWALDLLYIIELHGKMFVTCLN